MEHAITYRAYQEADFPALVQLVKSVWEYDQMLPPREAQHLAELDLLNCIRTRTFGQLALVDGVPVGFLFGELSGTSSNAVYDGRIRRARRALISRPRGMVLSAVSQKMNSVNNAMLNESPVSYGAKLSLFALQQDWQGYGIGKELFLSFMRYLKVQNVSEFYLFTDTKCNFGFYEHFHVTRRGEKSFHIWFGEENRVDFFLYGGRTEDALL